MMDWKVFGRKRSWHEFKIYPILSTHSHGGTEENHKNLIHDNILAPRSERESSGIAIRNVNRSFTTFRVSS
jgi:hypothetical protein